MPPWRRSLPPPRRVWRRRATAIAALLLLPLGTVALYLVVGSPGLPGEPLAPRLAALHGARSIDSHDRAGGEASRRAPRRCARLRGAGAGLSAARPFRRCGRGAAQAHRARRRHGRRGGRPRRGAGSGGERCHYRGVENRLRSRAGARQDQRSRRASSRAWRPRRTATSGKPPTSGAACWRRPRPDAPWTDSVREALARDRGNFAASGRARAERAGHRGSLGHERDRPRRHDPRHGGRASPTN